jgi:mannose-6-phosphate isomerase
MPVQPVKLLPRLDAKPWGGRRLEAWGIALPPGETIGEALLTAPEATVATGALAGMALGELAAKAPESWVGARGLAATGGRAIFPLLIKLIDGRADLSIQVHPDDRAAAAAHLGTGKTEAYHLLDAAPGSVLYLGLDPKQRQEEFAAACRRADGSAARWLRQIPATPGMTILIPAGTPHALGAGIVLYEIQQPSNVTFRLDDWGRVDSAGRARQLHHAAGLAVLDPRSRPEPISPLRWGGNRAERDVLVATRYFALERIALATDGLARFGAVASPQVFTGLSGMTILDAAGGPVSLRLGETVVVPAGLHLTLSAAWEAIVLRGWVPDLTRDVIAPARAAGVSETAIQRLGIATGASADREEGEDAATGPRPPLR